MASVVYPSGLVLHWDDTLQVGDLIIAHDPGYHILTAIEFREGATPLMSYVMVVRDDGTRVKKPGVTRTCDAAGVRRFTKDDIARQFDAEHNDAVIKRDNLLNFVPQ